MNNKIKIIIALGIIGILIMVAGFVMGSGPSSIPAIFSEQNIPDGAASVKDVQTADIRSIELNFFASKISIKSGESFDLSGSGQFDNYVLNGILYAGATDAKRSADIFGMKFNVPSKWICGYGSYVLVIPPDAKLDQITINTNHCDINCDSLMASKININVKNGDLTADKLIADNAAIDVNGDLNIASSQIAMNGSLNADCRLNLGTSGAAKESTMNNVTITNKRGGISLYGKLTGSSSLQTKHGNIEATLSGSRANYTFPATSDNLLIHDSAVTTKENEDTDPYGTVTIDSAKGNASVSFE